MYHIASWIVNGTYPYRLMYHLYGYPDTLLYVKLLKTWKTLNILFISVSYWFDGIRWNSTVFCQLPFSQHYGLKIRFFDSFFSGKFFHQTFPDTDNVYQWSIHSLYNYPKIFFFWSIQKDYDWYHLQWYEWIWNLLLVNAAKSEKILAFAWIRKFSVGKTMALEAKGIYQVRIKFSLKQNDHFYIFKLN